jgi:hypothetical protein
MQSIIQSIAAIDTFCKHQQDYIVTMLPPSSSHGGSTTTPARTIGFIVATLAGFVILGTLHMLSSEVSELRRLVVKEERIRTGDDLLRGGLSSSSSRNTGLDVPIHGMNENDPWGMGPPPPALPSIPLTEEEKKKDTRNYEKGYGGFGDARHVGGL